MVFLRVSFGDELFLLKSFIQICSLVLTDFNVSVSGCAATLASDNTEIYSRSISHLYVDMLFHGINRYRYNQMGRSRLWEEELKIKYEFDSGSSVIL